MSCNHCGEAAGLHCKCSTNYCSAKCQKAAWPEHKKICKPTIASKAPEEAATPCVTLENKPDFKLVTVYLGPGVDRDKLRRMMVDSPSKVDPSLKNSIGTPTELETVFDTGCSFSMLAIPDDGSHLAVWAEQFKRFPPFGERNRCDVSFAGGAVFNQCRTPISLLVNLGTTPVLLPIHLAWPQNDAAREFRGKFLLGLGPAPDNATVRGFVTRRDGNSYKAEFNCQAADKHADMLVIRPAQSRWLAQPRWLAQVSLDWGGGARSAKFNAHFDTGYSALALPLFAEGERACLQWRNALYEYTDTLIEAAIKARGVRWDAPPVKRTGRFDAAAFIRDCTCGAAVEKHRTLCSCKSVLAPVVQSQTDDLYPGILLVLDDGSPLDWLPPIVVTIGERQYKVPVPFGAPIPDGAHSYRPLNIATLPVASRDFVIGLPILLAIMKESPIHWCP